jgi:NAD(P)-dependent dehydrogenase (short-subunit alcohol dehydrogenase family)
MKRMGIPEEMAGSVLSYLANPRAAFSTGAHLVIDGGYFCC